MNDHPRILIVDDHELLAHTVAMGLKNDGFDVRVVKDISSDNVLKEAEEFKPHTVLLDLDLGSGVVSVSMIEPLTQMGASVLMLTGATDRIRWAECVEAGALGVVTKGQSFDELVQSVKEAEELHRLMSPGQREELLAELRQQRAEERARMATFEHLTRTEQEVLAALMDGKSAETIAKDRVVSLATARSQIRAVLVKLGVNSQLGAVALARRAGWEPEPPGGSG